MSYTTRLTPFTSLMMRVAVHRPRKPHVERIEVGGHAIGGGHRAQADHVFVSAPVAHDADGLSRAAARRRPARWCRISPALRISIDVDLIGQRRMSSFSRVISPGQRIARPGPGNGCRPTNTSGKPSSRPSALTSSLNSSRKRLNQLHVHARGQAADVVMRLDGHRRPAGERNALDHVGIERALREKIRAADLLLRFGVEHVDEQLADGLALDLRIGRRLAARR